MSVYSSHVYAFTLSGGYSIQDREGERKRERERKRGNLFMLDTVEINDGVNRVGQTVFSASFL